MKVLLVGVGGVGEGIAINAKNRPWLEMMVLTDFNLERAKRVQAKMGDPKKFRAEKVDAGKKEQITALARKYNVDLIMNAVTCDYNPTIFDAAYETGCTYFDMASENSGVNMGHHAWSHSSQWEEKGLLAITGLGMDPGCSDIFAKYAEKHLFDEIEEIGIRDGAALKITGYEFAPTFSIYDTLEECTDLPLVWEKDRGYFQTEPFSEPEIFNFPEGIGPIECVNVEHEEVLMIPRWVKCKRVNFKYGLGSDFINVINVIKMMGLHSKKPIDVKGVKVAPVDVVAALLPNPADLGDKMSGKTCVGTLVTGIKDSKHRKVYIYQVTDNQESMQKHGCQAVSWQTSVGPVIAMEMVATGVWKGKGVLGPEAFDPDPFMELMPQYNFPYKILEMEP
jgi:saccharopine dehydrogenase-like NADP-dependent oxidoreductase